MKNKYPGICYFCNKIVKKNTGHFERDHGKFRVIHSNCIFEQRKLKEKQNDSK